MEFLVFILSLAPCIMLGTCSDITYTDPSANISHPDKDMYVIHATVYQVGILTNYTDKMTDGFNSTGDQEAITFFHSNGSKVDLSGIPAPLMTNVTAQSLVGVAPVGRQKGVTSTWETLRHLASVSAGNVDKADQVSAARDKHKRSLDDFYLRPFKRATGNATRVKVERGTSVIPSEAGVQSIGLPPLLSLNNKFSDIPVPIPNTSVVHYAKVNALVQNP